MVFLPTVVKYPATVCTHSRCTVAPRHFIGFGGNSLCPLQAAHIGSSGGWPVFFPLMEVAGTGICHHPRQDHVTASTFSSRTEFGQAPESEDPLDNMRSVSTREAHLSHVLLV